MSRRGRRGRPITSEWQLGTAPDYAVLSALAGEGSPLRRLTGASALLTWRRRPWPPTWKWRNQRNVASSNPALLPRRRRRSSMISWTWTLSSPTRCPIQSRGLPGASSSASTSSSVLPSNSGVQPVRPPPAASAVRPGRGRPGRGSAGQRRAAILYGRESPSDSSFNLADISDAGLPAAVAGSCGPGGPSVHSAAAATPAARWRADGQVRVEASLSALAASTAARRSSVCQNLGQTAATR